VKSGVRSPLRVGTRGSRLAVWQTEAVIGRLRGLDAGLEFERKEISTTGDRLSDRPLARIGDRGLFTREIEESLADGRVDLAVHSLKDLPTTMPAGVVIAAILERADPSDVLVSPGGFTLATLPAGARVGTSSLRRRAQILALRPDVEVHDLRGNVPTRVAMVDRGDYRAAVMARAGLIRLGLEHRISEVISTEAVLPAVGQGAIAVQARAGDEALLRVLARLDHGPTRLTTTAERAFLAELQGGCQVPLAALGTWNSAGRLTLRGLVASPDGRQAVKGERSAAVADLADSSLDAAAQLGRELAAELVDRGARTILESARLPEGPEPK